METDWKKKYEEALNLAKSYYGKGQNEFLDTLFPELRESKDEKMLKRIRLCLDECVHSDIIRDYERDECVAYLEKQKEQKYLYYDQGFVEGMRQSKSLANAEIIVGPPKMTNKVSVSEELYEHIRETCACIDDAMSSETLVDITDYLGMADKSAQAAFDMLEKQKEQEHNEDDFTIYHPLKNGKGKYECIPYSFYGSLTSFSEDKDLIDFLRTCFYTEEECNEWIEQQKEQKPAEWSEKHIANIFEKVGLAKIAREQGNDKLTNALQDAMLKLSKVENTEWSDADNIGWDEAFACVTKTEETAKNEEELQNAVTAEKWLKEIKFKYYVHPVKQEWSEEDRDDGKFVKILVRKEFAELFQKLGDEI